VPQTGASSPKEWRSIARAFASEYLSPRAEAIDRSDRLPDDTIPQLRETGILGLGISPRWGGQGGDARDLVAVLEELAVGSAAVATMVSVHLSVCSHPIETWGTEAQKERYLRGLAEGKQLGAFGLTEPGVGSDAAHLVSGYQRRENGFVLSGTKMFITNAETADLLLLFATHDPRAGAQGISAFLVPRMTAGVSIAQRMDKLGIRGSETTEILLVGVQLPAEALLGTEGEGLRIALGSLTSGRVGIAACALGVARAAFEEMQSIAKKDPTDWKRAIVANAFTKLAAARALVERAAELKAAGKPFELESSAAKLVASRAAVEIASRTIDLAGPASVRSGARPERLLRDARVFPIVEGTTEIQELILGRTLIGR